MQAKILGAEVEDSGGCEYDDVAKTPESVDRSLVESLENWRFYQKNFDRRRRRRGQIILGKDNFFVRLKSLTTSDSERRGV